MSIKILEKSFAEHVTVENTTVTTMYQCTWEDYYNGIGDLVDENDNIITTYFRLPWIGDNFAIYYNTYYLLDCVLVDISLEPTSALKVSFDGTLQDLDKEIIITYTWSNEGASDTKRSDEASSWKIRFNTSIETVDLQNYIETTGGTKYVWPDYYYTQTNPTVVLPYVDSDGKTQEESYGAYNSQDTAIKKEFIKETIDEIPQIQKRIPNITVTVTAYSSFVRGSDLAEKIGYVNSDDFLAYVYQIKENALAEKNKKPSYITNDWIGGDDTGRWMFIDWEMQDLGNGFYQYDYTFEWSRTKWNTYTENGSDIDLKAYKTTNFYNSFLNGMDRALPNERDGR